MKRTEIMLVKSEYSPSGFTIVDAPDRPEPVYVKPAKITRSHIICEFFHGNEQAFEQAVGFEFPGSTGEAPPGLFSWTMGEKTWSRPQVEAWGDRVVAFAACWRRRRRPRRSR